MTERKFIQGLRNGELYAFEYFFEKYSKTLYRFSSNLIKSDAEAEEIVQITFLKIWEKRRQIDPDQSFSAYLFTVALNNIRKSFLAKAKEDQFKIDLFDFLMHQSNETGEEYNLSGYLKLLDQEIDRLPEKRREIFLLLKKDGLTVNEAAAFLNISPKTVENQLTAALKTIRAAFEEKGLRGLYLLFIQLLYFSSHQRTLSQ